MFILHCIDHWVIFCILGVGRVAWPAVGWGGSAAQTLLMGWGWGPFPSSSLATTGMFVCLFVRFMRFWFIYMLFSYSLSLCSDVFISLFWLVWFRFRFRNKLYLFTLFHSPSFFLGFFALPFIFYCSALSSHLGHVSTTDVCYLYIPFAFTLFVHWKRTHAHAEIYLFILVNCIVPITTLPNS